MFKKCGNLKVVIPENLPENILSFTTTKIGGYSVGCYSELNMGFHVGDDKKTVLMNYELLKKQFNINKIQILNQIHSSKVVSISKILRDYPDADGIITDSPNLALGIMTADCYNVQLIGNKFIANLHCGWRSIYSGIIKNTLNIFKENFDSIKYAVIGVGICDKCYEVNEELAEKFNLLVPKKNIVLNSNNTYFLNLREVLKNLINECGVFNIIHLNYCSSCDMNFYSHRRDKGMTGRMLSVLMRKNDKR